MEKFKSKQNQNCEELLYPLILDIFEESKKTYGVRRIKTALLNKHGLIVNHKCIRRIMHKYNLVCVLPKPKFKRRLQPFGTIENVLNRHFSTEKPLQTLCLDITYIRVNKLSPKWVYLCAVKDLYNNEMVAYDVSSSQNMMQVFRVLNLLT
ncbi:IS3 family transposase [Turicibacter sanguinis]|uniref:IS3 family transposase n=1 Tax=Turicibacter sanguinis TaxID=154288 RepID=UPI002330D624|nr:IS3 family transposase [Turicibacter sanguinis]MDB8562372.1 IS3 family transposase [Turicibacter sanguinis]